MIVRLKFSDQNTDNHILGLWNFKIFWGRLHPDLVDTIGYSIPTCPMATPIFIETPDDGLNTNMDMVYFSKCETTVFEIQTRDIIVYPPPVKASLQESVA